MLHLKIQKRDVKEKPEAVRKKGGIPAVFYGRKEESTPVVVSEKEFEQIWHEAGESSILSLEGVGEAKEALIQEVTTHPVSGKPIHADFYVIEKGKTLEVEVPLNFIGMAPAVKNLGGTLVKVLHELEIEALPKDLPREIDVDVSGLAELDSHLTIKDLPLPPGVKALADSDDIVVSIAAPKEEEEEVPGEIDMASIEVAGEKGKADEEAAVPAEDTETPPQK
ncbi:50S ribosomal protein L25 [Candidatus Wolfebacteria bacterium]|nr:50S ribosomal protein L25 [Candidatus Wolfebacteria bacterium]